MRSRPEAATVTEGEVNWPALLLFFALFIFFAAAHGCAAPLPPRPRQAQLQAVHIVTLALESPDGRSQTAYVMWPVEAVDRNFAEADRELTEWRNR